MALSTLAGRHQAGNAWLADCTDRPDLVQLIWDADCLAPLMTGGRWLVAESRLTSGWRPASRIREDQRGPILADPNGDRLWWLVPIDAADELDDVRQLRVHPPGWVLRCPPVGVQSEGRFWLRSPDGTGRLNDPAVVAAAFGPGGYRLTGEAAAW
ncbi:hypothetical protein [Streptomyces sp. NPDC093260]|uniref:hypothetical protein n=1 Tax=Streptomyces sp. NPDC093260 TaxID=3155073 RepID=UPI0034134392